jgi:methionyl-tRNA formyltransferase
MLKYIYFGTPTYALASLKVLVKNGFKPEIVVCSPDKPMGRKQIIIPGPVKTYAEENNLKVFQPEKINKEAIEYIMSFNPDYAIVAAYNKILPQNLIDLFPKGILNIHPSLLPLYRGPAPDIGPILNQDTETGVTIMLIDKDVDHGPILSQEKYNLTGDEFSKDVGEYLFTRGAEILCQIIPKWTNNEIQAKEQNHALATFTSKITKSDAEINPNDNPNDLWAKYRAYYPWPGLYFLDGNGLRIKITKASFVDGKFIIEKIISESGKEKDYNKLLN